ncbi:MAG: hypothetical protein ABTQ26_11790 [Azonexus sp.]
MTNTDRRFPKVLADELDFALSAVRELGPDLTEDLLARFRRNRTKCIATWGLFNGGAPVEGLEYIPVEHHWKIEKLDDAYEKLHHYRNGGAVDYVASAVAKEVSKARASLPRQRSKKVDFEVVAEYLKSKQFSEIKNQKKLIEEAKNHFNISERTVRGIAAKAGLTKARKQPTAT